jgi:hypothetical protein
MSRVRRFRFGPGSLESAELRMWAVPRCPWLVKARAVGTYQVYCGSGWEHTVEIDEAHSFDAEPTPGDTDEPFATTWTTGEPDAARRAAWQLVEWALEDWTDPCLDDSDEL